MNWCDPISFVLKYCVLLLTATDDMIRAILTEQVEENAYVNQDSNYFCFVLVKLLQGIQIKSTVYVFMTF